MSTATLPPVVDDDTALVYLIEGVPRVGTLADYARDADVAYLGGLDVSTSVWLPHNGRFIERRPTHTTSQYDSDCYATVRITLDDAMATFRIDGRA